MIQLLKQKYNTIPKHVQRFLVKALLLFAGWELLYNLVLLPTQIPDHQLKLIVGNMSAWILSFFYAQVHAVDMGYTVIIAIAGRRILGIAAACDGLKLMALNTGVLLCIPASAQRKMVFIAAGVLGICLLNAVRCAALAHIYMNHVSLFEVAHKWIFTLVVYFAVFGGWVLFIKGYEGAKV
jgi:exosortase/archaeosortase family protein